MDLLTKLPEMSDDALANLRTNAKRLQHSGTPAQRTDAAALLPAVEAEIGARRLAKVKATRTAPRDAISAGRSRLLRAQRSAPRLQETFPRSRSHRWSRSQPFPARSVGKSPSERRRDCCFVGTRNDGGGREGRNRRSHTNSTVDEYATNGVRAQELTVLLYISAISKRDKVCQAQFS